MKMAAAILAAILLAPQFAAQTFAQEYRHGDLVIGFPHARATPANAPVAGGYVTVRNTGAKPDRLVGVSANFAGRSEIHEMKMEDGVMKMRPLPDGLEIPAGGVLVLERGGSHLMFMQLDGPLREGETRKVTLRFERAGEVEVEFAVVPLGGPRGKTDGGMKQGGHGARHKH